MQHSSMPPPDFQGSAPPRRPEGTPAAGALGASRRGPRVGVGLAAALGALLFLACEPLEGPLKPMDAAAPVAAAPASTSGSPATAPATQAPKVAVDQDWVTPRFVPTGPVGGMPTGLVVEFGRPVYQQEGRLNALELGFKANPPVDVEARFVTPSTLRLIFRDNLAPDTRYAFAVTSVRGDKGMIVPEAPWEHTLVTPPFGLADVRLGYAAPGRGNVVLHARFTAPPAIGDVRDHLEVKLDGEVLAPAAVWARDDGVEVTLNSPKVVVGAPVEVRFTAGVRPRNATPLTVPLPEIPARKLVVGASTPVKILGVTVVETAVGMELEVRCEDPSSGPPETHWVDYEQVEAPPRCLPDETALARHLRLDPPLPYTLTSRELGFRIDAAFTHGPVKLSLSAGMPTIDGGRLEKDFNATVKVPRRSPQVRIAADGRYLPRGTWQALPVSLLNVSSVRVRIHRVPPENLAAFLDRYNEEPTRSESDLVADVVVDNLGGTEDQAHDAWIDLNRYLKDPAPGIYSVDLVAVEHSAAAGGQGSEDGDGSDDGEGEGDGEDGEGGGSAESIGGERAHDARRVVISDLQLVAKRGTTADGTTLSWQVHALDAHTLANVSGVEVKLLRPSGTVAFACKTSGERGCTVLAPVGTDVLALTARKGNDFTYLDLARLQTESSSSFTYGKPYRDVQPYTVAPFTDRGVWRPGESVHVGVLVRGVDLKAPPTGLPVALKLIDARYNEVRVQTGVTNPAGLVTYEVPIPESGLTGTWEAQFEVGGTMLGELRLPIEDIVPERMAVSVKPAAEWVGAGAPARFNVRARYLFGGDAVGSEVTGECHFEPKQLRPPGAPEDLTFGVLANAEHDLGEVSARLGDDGVELDCPLPATAPDGIVSLQVSVMEAGSGRATRGFARLNHHAAPLAVGLRAPGPRIDANKPVSLSGTILRWDGTPVAADVNVRVERLDANYGWHLVDASRGEVWERHLRATEALKVTVKSDAKGEFTVPFTSTTDAERFVIYAEVETSKAKVFVEGASPSFDWDTSSEWDRPSGSSRTPGPSSADRVALTTPKEVEVGSAVEATFEAPFAGRALLTIETDRLENAEWVKVSAGTNRWPFKVTRFAPNMYLGVLVVKDPHLESPEAWLPARAYGVQSVRVIPQGQVLAPTLAVPAELRPSAPLVVEVDAGLAARDADMADGVVIVAAVDEGILQLTQFKTPDPNADLLARRALAVATFETFGWGLRLASRDRTSPSGGGDDGEEGDGLSDRAVVEPLAVWSGPVKLDARGKATVTLALPRHTGKLRVMAVFSDRSRVGVADAFVAVRDPLALLATAPLFARRGDRIELPVHLSNLTGAAADVQISIEAEGGVVFTGPGGKLLEGKQTQSVSLAADASHVAVFGAKVTAMSGQARILVHAVGGGAESHEEVRIDLRPEGALEHRTQTMAMPAGAPLDLAAQLDRDFLPGTEQWGVRLALDETEDALDHLRGLARYPHGCLEQVTSQARPLLALGTLFEDLSPGLNPSLGATRRLQKQATLGLDDLIKVAVEKVLAMQTSAGGFAYWAGGTQSHGWGTTQAILFLLDAQAAGYPVAESRLDSAISWLSEHIDTANEGDDGRIASTQAWMHYTLARAGRPEKARIAQVLETTLAAAPAGPPSEAVTLLRAALYLSGDRRHADALKAEAAADIGQARVLSGDFWSDLRQTAVEASIFVELFGSDPAGKGRIEAIARRLRGHHTTTYTTSELAWSLYAVARWRQASSAKLPEVHLTAGAKEIAPRRPAGGAWWLTAPSPGGGLTLTAGAGAAIPPGMRVVLTQEGVRPPAKAWHGAEGLSVTRTIVDGDGKPVDLARIRLGQLLYVRLDLKNLGVRAIPNVALVDPLPAGLSVENARLFGEGDAEQVKGDRTGWMPEHLDVRDDRVAAFGTLEPEREVSLVYAARAVVAGTWQAPGAEVEAMYDPRLRARNAPGEITVIAPWTERM